jgi:hypothetical protein
MHDTRYARRPWERLGAHALLLGALAGGLLFAAACSSSAPSSYGGSPRDNYGDQRYGGGYLGGRASGDTEAGAAFARWVLEQDPQRQYITDAVVRDERSLGVKVQPNITKGDLQQLLTALAEGMAGTFPGKPIEVIAFYQSGDKLAEANYDPRSNRVAFR